MLNQYSFVILVSLFYNNEQSFFDETNSSSIYINLVFLQKQNQQHSHVVQKDLKKTACQEND